MPEIACNEVRIMPEIVSKLFLHCHMKLLCCSNSNLSKRPRLGQLVDLDLLLCTGFNSEHMGLFLCHSFAKGPMNDQKIE